MALTKPEYWLISLGLVIIMSMSLLYFGNSLQNDPNITLDQDSQDYLALYTKEVNNSGIQSRADDSIELQDVQNPVLKWLLGNKLLADAFGLFTVLVNALTGLWNFIIMAINLPSFFINTLGIETLGSIKYIINTIGAVLLLSLTILLVRLTK